MTQSNRLSPVRWNEIDTDTMLSTVRGIIGNTSLSSEEREQLRLFCDVGTAMQDQIDLRIQKETGSSTPSKSNAASAGSGYQQNQQQQGTQQQGTTNGSENQPAAQQSGRSG